jgi:hypothetical protein
LAQSVNLELTFSPKIKTTYKDIKIKTTYKDIKIKTTYKGIKIKTTYKGIKIKTTVHLRELTNLKNNRRRLI